MVGGLFEFQESYVDIAIGFSFLGKTCLHIGQVNIEEKFFKKCANSHSGL